MRLSLKRAWIASLLFAGGMAFGMFSVNWGYPPWTWLKAFDDYVMRPDPIYGSPQPEHRRVDVDGLISITTPGQAEALRRSLIAFLWGAEHLPDGGPDKVARNAPLGAFAGFANLARVERFRIDMPYAVRSEVRHLVPLRSNGTLVIFHHGHNPPSEQEVHAIRALVAAGFGVAVLAMPLVPPNNQPLVNFRRLGPIRMTNHEYLALLEPARGHPIQYLLEPTVRTINHLQHRYRRIAMAGHSGGGWTTTMMAALDPRIGTSVAMAGSHPLSLRLQRDWGDYEQHALLLYRVANYPELYVLGAFGPGRKAVHIFSRYDPCCFAGSRSELYAPAVAARVRQLGPGGFELHIDEGKEHGISEEALRIMLGALRQAAAP